MQQTTTAEIVRFPDHVARRDEPKRSRRSRSLKQRLADKVDTSGGPLACHPFTGSIMQANGYGQIAGISPKTHKQTMRSTHVVAWELANGRSVPDGALVLHSHVCKSKTCCNPAHLRIGTAAENSADAKAAGKLGRRLTKAEVLEIVMLHQRDGVSASALAHRFKVDPSVTRRILRGETHAKLTGIERHKGKAGRPSTVRASAPAAPAPVIVLHKSIPVETDVWHLN